MAAGLPGEGMAAEPPWPADARCIVHMDLDCFYASVERLQDPSLQGRPVAVVMGLEAGGRGVVTSATYEARALGVHSAQTLVEARRRCPDLVALPVRHALYSDYSRQVMRLLHCLSPRVQQLSIDEAFVELAGPHTAWPALAAARHAIMQDLGLPCSFGIATSKLVAKIATRQGKPRGFVVVPPGSEAAYLMPLPVGSLWGVGPRTRARLQEQGVTTLGELAVRDPTALAATFGPRRAMELHRQAQGIDDSPLVTERRYQSISAEHTFGHGEADARKLWALYREMAADLAQRLAQQELVARTVGIKMRLEDWTLLTRERTVPDFLSDAPRLAAIAGELMREHWQRRPIRLIGLRVSGLCPKPDGSQLALYATMPAELPERAV